VKLYHFTCIHRALMIGRRGTLQPYRQPVLGGRAVVWATDMPEPDADALGLTSTILPCDRTEVRYLIREPDAFTPWFQWWPSNVHPTAASALTYPPKRPARWWVAVEPVRAVRA
jgi:hypothetical protein